MKKVTFLIFSLVSMYTFAQTSELSITDQAITEMQNENYQKALVLFNKAILKNPKDKEALEYRAYTKLQTKNYAGALLDINKAIVIDTLCSSCYDTRAEIKYRMNDLKSSVIDYEKAFSISPNLANGETHYYVAKSKLASKTKPKGIAFVPNATFIEKIITSKLTAIEFKNEYYDYIESYDSTNSLTYNEKTKEHDIPEYSAEVVCKYKGAKIFFTLNSKTDKDPINYINVSVNCICDWFSSWKDLSTNGFKETKRYDQNGILEISGEKTEITAKYTKNINRLSRNIIMWRK